MVLGLKYTALRSATGTGSLIDQADICVNQTPKFDALAFRFVYLLTPSSAFAQRLQLLAVPFTNAESSHGLWQFAISYPTFNRAP